MKKKIRNILSVLLAAVFLFSAGMMIRQQIQYREIAAANGEAAQAAGIQGNETAQDVDTQEGETSQTDSSPQDPLPEEAAHLAGVNLEALREINGDIVGWIEIPGTEISHPLLQGQDNQFYLTHNWKKEESAGGSLFLEVTGSRSLTDFNTIVYGHRMRNETMFGSLKYYEEPDFWREHPSVYIVLEDAVYRYDIFSAQKAGIKEMVYRLDIEEKGLEEELISWCVENSVIDTGIVPAPEDRIVTLSTCTGSGYSRRWIVQGVLAQIYDRE